MSKSPTSLGTENVGSLLLKYSVPAIIAQMAASLYNIVDSIFIGQGVGALAISGLAITFPLINLAAAFGSLVGAGGSALVSIKLGQKDHWGATEVLGCVTMLNLVMGVVLMILGLAFLDPMLYFFGASADTIAYARDYMQVILYGNVVTHLYLGLNNTMRSTGYPTKAMIMTLLTVFVNAVLDWLFIVEFGWGIKGAAIATILAQVVALVGVIWHFCQSKHFIHYQRGIFRLKKHVVSGIFSIGMAPFMLNACACLIVILINQAMARHGGDFAIGAYGIVNRVVMLFVMLVLGFNLGMQPIAGYNFGAGLFSRVSRVLRLTIFCACGVTTIAFLCCELFPHQIARMFTTDQLLIDMSARGMQITVLIFPIVGFQMVVANFFQSIGKAHKAIFLSTTRQLLFLVPFILILPNSYGIDGIWYSMPISDFLATFTSAVLLYRQIKDFRAKEAAKSMALVAEND